ncbi:helix-turn-helix domain-containing protein [Demequina zhanjiangensis]|uniref:Helix-turn-helix domain-containing protein n=1 Tax=Demequina zhanjiangensis TaxID=3051659 RepID=A0ABT8G2Y3_9MICO|nr:helix-turn-helix domain-containing protein [Demequina sp. SYSU T00b26]MDN4473504.1 helix-turn-helix domain-containing protein [Demequina sp. SYSU T00b26]
MDPRRSRLLLHPVRIRVSLVLSQSEMNVKQLAKVLDDVPQASLYRAVSELLEGGIIEVTREERRGGAIERYFRAIEEESLISRQDIGSLSPAEFVAGIEGLNRMLAADASRYIADEQSSWVDDFTIVDRMVAHLDAQEAQEIEEQLRAVLARLAAASEPRPGTTPHVLNLTVFPYRGSEHEEDTAASEGELESASVGA